MKDRGVFAVDRGVFDHPMFAPEPFTEREAWLWLVGAAAWKAMRLRAGKAIIALERGQCAFATRFLARRFKWSESRVRRFLKRLKIDAMVTTQTTRETTLITICNYDKYAFGRRIDVPQIDAQTGALATHERRKEEEINNSKKEELSSADALAGKYVYEREVVKLSKKHFDQWLSDYPLLDLKAELAARDAWLVGATERDRKNWFISTSKYLANRNAEARARGATTREDDVYPAAIYGNLQ